MPKIWKGRSPYPPLTKFCPWPLPSLTTTVPPILPFPCATAFCSLSPAPPYRFSFSLKSSNSNTTNSQISLSSLLNELFHCEFYFTLLLDLEVEFFRLNSNLRMRLIDNSKRLFVNRKGRGASGARKGGKSGIHSGWLGVGMVMGRQVQPNSDSDLWTFSGFRHPSGP